jgi:hypothetical protein
MAVAVPVKMPADNPDSTRPRNRLSTPAANRKISALTPDSTSAGSSSERRPATSDARPSRKSAPMTPSA